MRPIHLTLLGLAIMLPAATAAAAPFDSVPADKAGGSGELLISIVEYQGNTNGAITVDVKNPTARPQRFSAKGLYFVPQTNANQAPQRLGAVGPFRARGAGEDKRLEQMTIAPGATERLTLDVYCIDSHRASPNPKTPFRVAKDRVPPALTRAIDADAAKAAAPHGGVSAPAAKSAVQSEVWKNRDAKWIKLEGEGAQEAAKR
jgi:hypothetical protein